MFVSLAFIAVLSGNVELLEATPSWAPSGMILGENVKYKIDLWFYNYEKLNVNMDKDPNVNVQIKAFI